MSANSRWGSGAQQQVDNQIVAYKNVKATIPEFVFAVVYQQSNRRKKASRVFVTITPGEIAHYKEVIERVDGITTPVACLLGLKLERIKEHPQGNGMDSIFSATLLPPDGDVLYRMLSAEEQS